MLLDVYGTSGSLLHSYASGTNPPNLQLESITAGPDGNLWFCAQDSNLIGKVTTSGSLTTFPLPSANAQPYGITAGADGNLWFTEARGNLPPAFVNKIGRITPAGTITEFPIPTAASGASTIASGPNNTIWFTEGRTNKIGVLYL